MNHFFSILIAFCIQPNIILCRRNYRPSIFRELDNMLVFEANGTSHLSRIVTTPSGDLLIGGNNVLYKLSADMNVLDKTSIGPKLNNLQCYPLPEECDFERSSTDNEVKVLLIYQNDYAIVCGTVDQGMCSLYIVDDLQKAALIGDPTNPVNYVAGNSSVSAFMVGDDLYSAATYDNRAPSMSHFFFTKKEINTEAGLAFQYSYKSESSVTGVDFDPMIKQSYPVVYVYGFSHQGYSYFVTVQKITPHIDKYESRVIRVCQNDTRFFSYTEIPIKCLKESGEFNLATAAFLASSVNVMHYNKDADGPPIDDRYLYITFAKSRYADVPDGSQGSVLCRFPMAQITASFVNATRDCFNGENRAHRLESILGTKAPCNKKKDFDLDEILCDPGGNNNYIEGREKIPGSLRGSIKNEIATSLFVTVQHSHAVAFIGTKNGNLLKLSLKSNDSPLLYNFSLNDDKKRSVRRSNAFDENQENLYLLTGNKVVKFPIGSCKPYKDCKSCLSNSDPLKCGWCGSFCAHKAECGNQQVQTVQCPPIIYKISPLFGPVQGNTEITIEGDNFGNGKGSLNVSINDISCDVIVWGKKTIKCRTNASPEMSESLKLSVRSYFDQHSFDAEGTVLSDDKFTFMTPKFYGIRPSFGPKAGGTNVTVFGENLNIGNSQEVVLVGMHCKIQSINGSTIECSSGSIRSPNNNRIFGTAAMAIDGSSLTPHTAAYQTIHPNETIHSYYKYLEDPVIQSISPSVTTKSGGTNLTVYGQNFNHIQQPKIVIKIVSDFSGKQSEIIRDCNHADSEGLKLICTTPSLDHSIPFSHRAPLRALMSFIMDGVEDLRNFSLTHTKLSELLYYPDPVYHKFAGSRNIFDVPVDDPVVEIRGVHLNLAQTKKDVIVKIQGPTPCNVTKIDLDTLYCIIPQTFVPAHKNDTLKSVEVYAGSLHFNVGYIQYVDPSFKLGITAIVFIVLASLILIVIVLLVLYKKRIIFKRKKVVLPGYAVSFHNEADDHNPRTANEYSDHLMTGRTRSNPGDGGGNGGACGGEASSSSRGSLFGNRVSEETVQLLEADDILFQRTYLTVLDVIGQGHFGRVYKGILKLPGKDDERAVAVKTLQNSRYRDNEDVESFLQEGLMMKDFHHHNVLTLIGVCFEDDGFPMVIIPFMANGDLLSYIRDENNYPTVKDLLTFGIHIAEGMKYLSDLKFVHRDLAARNCMIDEDLTLKVADFGLSRDIYERDYYSSDNKKSKLPVKWMAPESLEKGTYSNKSDVWSYGVVLWELMTRGVTPYPEVDNWEILQFVKSGRRMLQPSFCPELLYQLMLRCWTDDSKSRPGFAEIAEEVKEIIRKMETKSKHMRVGTNATYYNCPIPEKDNSSDGATATTTTPILNGGSS